MNRKMYFGVPVEVDASEASGAAVLAGAAVADALLSDEVSLLAGVPHAARLRARVAALKRAAARLSVFLMFDSLSLISA